MTGATGGAPCYWYPGEIPSSIPIRIAVYFLLLLNKYNPFLGQTLDGREVPSLCFSFT